MDNIYTIYKSKILNETHDILPGETPVTPTSSYEKYENDDNVLKHFRYPVGNDKRYFVEFEGRKLLRTKKNFNLMRRANEVKRELDDEVERAMEHERMVSALHDERSKASYRPRINY